MQVQESSSLQRLEYVICGAPIKKSTNGKLTCDVRAMPGKMHCWNHQDSEPKHTSKPFKLRHMGFQDFYCDDETISARAAEAAGSEAEAARAVETIVKRRGKSRSRTRMQRGIAKKHKKIKSVHNKRMKR